MYRVWRQLVSWTKNDKVGLEGWGGLRVGFGDRLQFEIGWLVTCEQIWRRSEVSYGAKQGWGFQGKHSKQIWGAARRPGCPECNEMRPERSWWRCPMARCEDSDFHAGWDRSHCGVWGTEVMWSDLWLKRIPAGSCVEHRVQWRTRDGTGRPIKRDRSQLHQEDSWQKLLGSFTEGIIHATVNKAQLCNLWF